MYQWLVLGCTGYAVFYTQFILVRQMHEKWGMRMVPNFVFNLIPKFWCKHTYVHMYRVNYDEIKIYTIHVQVVIFLWSEHMIDILIKSWNNTVSNIFPVSSQDIFNFISIGPSIPKIQLFFFKFDLEKSIWSHGWGLSSRLYRGFNASNTFGPEQYCCCSVNSIFKSIVQRKFSSFVSSFIIQMYFVCKLALVQWQLTMIQHWFLRIILWMRPANERGCYIVTSSLFGWAHTQNDPWVPVIASHHLSQLLIWLQTGCIK